jgi:hypothetical protein
MQCIHLSSSYLFPSRFARGFTRGEGIIHSLILSSSSPSPHLDSFPVKSSLYLITFSPLSIFFLDHLVFPPTLQAGSSLHLINSSPLYPSPLFPLNFPLDPFGLEGSSFTQHRAGQSTLKLPRSEREGLIILLIWHMIRLLLLSTSSLYIILFNVGSVTILQSIGIACKGKCEREVRSADGILASR